MSNKNNSQHHPKWEEIVSIASRLFYTQGYGATGIKQIIDEAGIAKGTFYTHFKSKEELGVAWLQARHTQWNGWLNEELESAPDSDTRVLAAFDFLARWLQDSDYRGCAFLNTMAEIPDPESPMRQEVASHKQGLLETFQNLMLSHAETCLQCQKKASTQDLLDKGSTAYLLFEGALVEAQNFHQTWPVDRARQEVAATLLHR